VHLDDDTKRGYPDKAKDLAMVGVDIKYNQLRFIAPLIQDLMEAPFLLRYCHNRRVRIVHMYRRNVLHQALSLAIADHRNVYHNYQGRKFEGQVTIPAKKVTESCYWIREQRDLFRQLSKDLTVLEVAYEDVAQACESAGSGKPLAQKSAVMQQIADFLQLPNKFTSPTSIAKVINRPFKEILANHAEVLAAVKRSEFAEFATTM
jgi:LPS sulfotransferase NodH